MSTLTLSMASPNSLKRTYAEAGLEVPDSVQYSQSAFQTTPPSSIVCTQGNGSSPACPATQARSSPPGLLNEKRLSYSATTVGLDPPTKKPNLTFADKEAKRIEKAFKDQQKAEGKAKKEEDKARKKEEKAKKEAEKEAEKAKREEEKRIKDYEKEEKRRLKEEQAKIKLEEKQFKEEERHRKEEEKIKKASSQLRLNAFFLQPSSSHPASSVSPTRGGPSPLSSRRSSISEVNAVEARRSRTASATPRKVQLRDYERCFQPFFLKSHTTLAPTNRFPRGEEGILYAREELDKSFAQTPEAKDDSRGLNLNVKTILHISQQHSCRNTSRVCSVKDVIAEIEGAAQNSMDLTESQFKNATKKPLDLLKTIPFKYLKFAEDVRPPYIGTYTRLRDTRSISKLSRNPFSRALPETDYNYDSEAEWEEPGEGEDLDSEGEEEIEDEDEAEMEGFLDDEEAADARALKRRPILGDLEPMCSDACWEGPHDPDLSTLDLLMFRLDMLIENAQLPIDPYSTVYWQPTISENSTQASPRVQGGSMEPPRVPLNPVNRHNALLSPSTASKDATSDPSTIMKPPKGPRRLLPSELMDEFKDVVQGNDLTKIGLLEILKKKFPKQPKDAIRDTLEMVAERVGPKPTEKKWVMKSGL